jgi:hypothetical protein
MGKFLSLHASFNWSFLSLDSSDGDGIEIDLDISKTE